MVWYRMALVVVRPIPVGLSVVGFAWVPIARRIRHSNAAGN